jgi:photosystem II stability/assembly factor-like uncharacterized protein
MSASLLLLPLNRGKSFYSPLFYYRQILISFLVVVLWVYLLIPNTLFAQQKKQQKLYDDLFSVSFQTEKDGWAAGDWGTLLYTNDGGKTWIDKTLPKDIVLYSIDFQGEDEGWIACELGTILHTQDGGKTWIPQQTGVETTLFGVSFTSRKEGVAVGLDGVILKTEDGGRSWQKVELQLEAEREEKRSLYDVKLMGTLGIAVGDAGKIITTIDGGKTWTTTPLPMDMYLVWLRAVTIVKSTNSNKGIIVGARSITILTQNDKLKLTGSIPTLQPSDNSKNKELPNKN